MLFLLNQQSEDIQFGEIWNREKKRMFEFFAL